MIADAAKSEGIEIVGEVAVAWRVSAEEPNVPRSFADAPLVDSNSAVVVAAWVGCPGNPSFFSLWRLMEWVETAASDACLTIYPRKMASDSSRVKLQLTSDVVDSCQRSLMHCGLGGFHCHEHPVDDSFVPLKVDPVTLLVDDVKGGWYHDLQVREVPWGTLSKLLQPLQLSEDSENPVGVQFSAEVLHVNSVQSPVP